ncbi:MAG: hypothetical protein Kow00105_11090 [Phycisphaeraceae bacterium]
MTQIPVVGWPDVTVASLGVLLCCTTPTFAAFSTTGIYDNTNNGNVVDVSATSDAGELISLSSFKALVDLAYQADAGGVIDFDNGSLTDPNTIDATLGISQTRNITLTDATANTLQVSSPASAISGNASLRKTLSTFSFDKNDFKFDFDPDDGVVAVGATLMSQFTLGQPVGNVWAIVRYDDATSSQSVTDFIENSSSGDDTFWGFQAPEGKYIVRFELIISNDKWVQLDDLGVVLEFKRPPVSGDLDGDGYVGISDLNIVLGLWNKTVSDGNPADPSGDNFVGIADLNIVLGNWNGGIPPAAGSAVPEPGTCAILSLFGAGCLVWGRVF